MISVKNGIVNIHRGDDGAIPVLIMCKGQPYHMQEGDKLTFTVRELPDHSSPVLLRVESDEDIILLTHEQTVQIPVGKYSCDVQLTRANGMVTTVFPCLKGKGCTCNLKNFIVDAEVSD